MIVGGTAPYPWPYDAGLDGGRLALVVAGGGWEDRVQGAAATAAALERLEGAVLAAGGLVVHLAHRPAGGPPPWGTAEDVVVLAVPGLDGFYGSALPSLLTRAGRDLLLVAGYGLEAAVHSTLRGANDQGWECLLVADACAPVNAELSAAAVSMVLMSGGIFGAVGEVDHVCAALLRQEVLT